MGKEICFVLPGYSWRPSGGQKVVYQYAHVLADSGCDVTLCFCCDRSLASRNLPEPVRRLACRFFTAISPRWFDLDDRVKKLCIFDIADDTIPDGDDVVATAAQTARPVASLSDRKGNKHYLIQGYENWTLSDEQLNATFRLGMSNIVVSDWLGRLVQRESGIEPRLIKNAIDERVFYPDAHVHRNEHEVAALYSNGEVKGFDDLYVALCEAKETVPDLVVNLFGGLPRPDALPEWFRYTQQADQTQLRAIYSRSSIFACATVNEGFGLTLPESMFCGCALAATDFLGVHEYATGDCALLSPVHDPHALAQNLVRLLLDPELTSRLALAGRAYAMTQCSGEKSKMSLLQEFGIKACPK